MTYALREALYGLDAIADILDGQSPQNELMTAMETEMQSAPNNWAKYYSGSEVKQFFQRHYSLSDRIRYYWGTDGAKQAVDRVFARLKNRKIPAPLIGQFLGGLSVQDDDPDAETVLIRAVQDFLAKYHAAIIG